ncbi:hypothetical protein JM47_00845 [Ureaplasma diversum]|uniref:Uncharacterized protein n=1 Tax=Ureaplasma diversum TaxID=42094 RepID=A0A0C5S1C2_9BACT
MAGVSVIGVVAACAPTKAKPAKPTEKKVEQPQTSGTESSKTGSGSGNATTGTKQGSENNTTTPSAGSTNTNPGATQPTTPESGSKTKPEDSKGSGTDSESKKDDKTENKPNLGSDPSNGSDDTNKKTETEGKVEEGKNDNTPKTAEENGTQSDTPTEPQAPPAANSGSDSTKKDMEADPGKTDAKKMEGSGSEDPKAMGDTSGSNNEQQNSELQLKTKKDEAKASISKLSNLLANDKKEFEKQIDAITKPEQINQINDILKEATNKDTERKNKLTPTNSVLNYDATNKRNYLRFEFKTSKETFDKIKKQKLTLLLQVRGKDGSQYNPVTDAAATWNDGSNIVYIGTKDGLYILRIETNSYFVKELNSPEGYYKLIGLSYMENDKKIELLNQPSQEIEVSYSTASAPKA